MLSQGGIAPDDADSRTVRQILALQQIKKSSGLLSGHIVVELLDIDNLAMTNLVGKEDVEAIVSHELIGRLMLLAARSPWIAPVLSSIMGFEGSEFYFKEWPELVGSTFGSVCFRFDEAVPVGVKLSKDGSIMINPPDELVLNQGDQILVLAEDDDSYTVNDRAPTFSESLLHDRRVERLERAQERMLFCGWRRDMADMIMELDLDVKPGSELWLFNTVPVDERAWMLLDAGNKAQLRVKNLRIRHAVGNPTSRRQLLSLQEVSDGSDGLEIGARTGHRVVLSYFTSILILSDSARGDDEQDVEASDSRSLATTLSIQDIQQASMLRMAALGKNLELFPPISEILDTRTAKQMQLISQGYVMSNHLVASYLAMVSEDRSVNKIYGELLSCRGSEIRVVRVADYVRIGPEEPLSFTEVARIARSLNDLLIGHIAHQPGRVKELRRGLSLHASKREGGEILLNPARKDEPRLWDPEDRLIIISLCHQARRKAELRELCGKAEKELLENTLSAGGVAVYGWIKKLGGKRHYAVEMDNEDSWRERLAFVVDGAMYYQSQKRKGRELVCRLDDIRHIEAGNGWPPGHFTFKVYLARDPKSGSPEKAEDLPLDVLPSRVFSTQTLEECRSWVAVLSGGRHIQAGVCSAGGVAESPRAAGPGRLGRMGGESGGHDTDVPPVLPRTSEDDARGLWSQLGDSFKELGEGPSTRAGPGSEVAQQSPSRRGTPRAGQSTSGDLVRLGDVQRGSGDHPRDAPLGDGLPRCSGNIGRRSDLIPEDRGESQEKLGSEAASPPACSAFRPARKERTGPSRPEDLGLAAMGGGGAVGGDTRAGGDGAVGGGGAASGVGEGDGDTAVAGVGSKGVSCAVGGDKREESAAGQGGGGGECGAALECEHREDGATAAGAGAEGAEGPADRHGLAGPIRCAPTRPAGALRRLGPHECLGDPAAARRFGF